VGLLLLWVFGTLGNSLDPSVMGGIQTGSLPVERLSPQLRNTASLLGPVSVPDRDIIESITLIMSVTMPASEPESESDEVSNTLIRAPVGQ
jgi:hypothetical protein